MAGGQLPFGFAPQGELTNYTPTLRERAADWLRQQLFTDDRAGQDKANRLVNWGETMLPPFGFATTAYDAGRSGGQGDYLTAGMLGAMAMAPGIKTRGGKSILPHETGWVFKDVKSPNKVMEKGDWRLVNLLEPQQVELPIGSMNATQKTVNPDFSAPISQNNELPFVIKKNGEYFVQDGHHRLTKIAMDGKQTANVRLVDLDGTTQTDFPLVDMMQQQQGIRAYHGSPHSFDKFSMDKIGTGEGAQAYGHGLYFAENENIAASYRDSLSPGTKYKGGSRYQVQDGTAEGSAVNAVMDLVTEGMSPADAMAAIKKRYLDAANSMDPALFEQGSLATRAANANRYRGYMEIADAVDALNADDFVHVPGSMYEVEINADPNAFLDWDKPLSEQPEAVRSVVDKWGVERGQTENQLFDRLIARGWDEAEARAYAKNNAYEATGEHIYRDLIGKVGGNRDKLAEKYGDEAYFKNAGDLANRELGIPGIKYLDAGSRSAGDGTRNYVVFDDKLISIVRKYGIAGASALLGYNLLDGLSDAQAAELKKIEGK